MRVSFYSDKMELLRDVNVPEDVVENVNSMWEKCTPEVRAIFGYSFHEFIKMIFQANYIECGDKWSIKSYD